MTNLIPYVSSWILLAVIVLGLALYRKIVSMHEDDYVHMSEGEARSIPEQVAVNRKLAKIDFWGKVLTVVTILAGLGRACLYLYSDLYLLH
jgi:hypothetical protein